MNNFVNKNILHLSIQGQREKLLPVQLHFLQDDLVWVNDNKTEILDDICVIVRNNLEFIEKRSKTESKVTFARLNAGKYVNVAFTTIRSADSKYNIVVFPNSSSAHCPSLASFTLVLWAFKLDPNNPLAALPIDE
jgi:hypothetical protein